MKGTAAVLDAFAELVSARTRMYFTGHKRQILGRKLECRVDELRISSLDEYLDMIRRSDDELFRLVDILTTNETFFFRNTRQFEYLTRVIVPLLEGSRAKDVVSSWGLEHSPPARDIMKLRIFCAGCSTGEEPYSVAMAVLEGLKYPKAWDIRIFGGDISRRCLSVAEAGFYPDDSLRNVPRPYLKKYFAPAEGGSTIRDEIRELITFHYFNFHDFIDGRFTFPDGKAGNFDLIFCRNVMIYFSPESQQELVNSLSGRIVPGGYLFTGDAEPLHLFDHDFQQARDAGCLIYKKSESPNDARAV